MSKYLQKNSLESNYSSKSKLQGNGVGLDTTPDYSYYKVLNKEKAKFRNAIVTQINADKDRKMREEMIIHENDVRNARIYEKKMRIIERLQHQSKERLKNNLRNEMANQSRHKMSRSFYA